MQRLEYHLTVQSDGVVTAVFNDGKREIPSRPGKLDLPSLETITRDYLPFLEAEHQQTRDRLERLGTLLYRILFSESIAAHFEARAWDRVREFPDRFYLALSLTFGEGVRPDVAALPWEFLYFPYDHTFLATDRRVAFSHRHPDDLSFPREPSHTDEPLSVMLVRLQPEDMPPVAMAPILNPLKEAARENSRLLPPIPLENPTPMELEEAIEKFRPHILHLLLHGRFEDRSTRFALVNSTGQAVRWYGDRSLADLFGIWRPHLVLLQACEGGRSSDLISFAGGAAWLVRKHIPAVVAMRYPITNRVGWSFAGAFYKAILAGEDTDVAVQRARRALARVDETSPDDHANRDFGAPILRMRPNAHRLFHHQEEIMEAMETKDSINITIVTSDQQHFEADVPPDMLVGRLVQDFLSQWRPPCDLSGKPKRYLLRPEVPDAPALDSSSTLEQAGVKDNAGFKLAVESLAPDSPIGLTIEDREGRRFVTAVALNITIRRLAEEFLGNTPGRGRIVVELLSGPPGTQPRPLNLDASLYEEGLSDNMFLKIYRIRDAL